MSLWCQNYGFSCRHENDDMAKACQKEWRDFRHRIDMNTFIGREREQAEFRELLAKKNSSLVTCHGRRRIGKSRFIQQCAKQANAFFEFSGLPPRPGLTKKVQLTAFSKQLSKQSKAPQLPLDNWSTAFQLLASQHTVLYAGPYRVSDIQAFLERKLIGREPVSECF
jgi:AAA+ ATPase superfamily predicted ATPase